MLRIYPVILDWLSALTPIIASIRTVNPSLADQLQRSSASVALTRIVHEAERRVVVRTAQASLKLLFPDFRQRRAAHQRDKPFAWVLGRGAVVFECYIKPRTSGHAIGSSAGRFASCIMRASPHYV